MFSPLAKSGCEMFHFDLNWLTNTWLSFFQRIMKMVKTEWRLVAIFMRL